MRRRFKTDDLRDRFDVAWESIPTDVSKALRPFIRQVREVDSLSGIYIECPDGTRYGPLGFGTGYTFFYKDSSIAFCDILLPSILLEASKAEAITIMLHELSHTWEYYQSYKAMINQDEFESETRVWRQAAEWAKLGIRDASLAAEISDAAFSAKLQMRLTHLLEQLCNQ